MPVLSVRDAESLLGLHLHKLLRYLGVTMVLDAGARKGEYGIWLRNNGYTGPIASFEPIRHNFEALYKRAQGDASWSVYQLALGSSDGSADINVARQTHFSSFLKPNAYSASQFGVASEVERTEHVQVARLDTLFAQIVANHGQRVFLKMDTQGWDLEILSGATGCLDRIAALQSEVSALPLYDGMPTFTESISRFKELGFAVSGLFPVNLDSQMAAIEFDCVAVRVA